MDNKKKKKIDPKDHETRQNNRQKNSTGVDKINEQVEANRNRQLQENRKKDEKATIVTPKSNVKNKKK